jgi:gliding motility-associated-like protein
LCRKAPILATLLTLTTLAIYAQGGTSAFEFVENKGQWDSRIKFKGQLPAGDFYLQRNGFTVVQHNTKDLQEFFEYSHGGKATSAVSRSSASHRLRSHAYQVQFVGASENSLIIPDKVLPTYNNYIIGNDPSKWAGNVKIYQAVVYKNIYPNIDVRYYSEYGRLKYDLVVNPGGDASDIIMKYEGADKLVIRNNELIIKTSVGDVKELYPYSYQFDKINGKKEVSCKYEFIDKKTVRFAVTNYSKNNTLIIDPTLIFSSFTGSRASEWGFTATPGPDGSLYSGGIVFGAGYLTSPGAYDQSYATGGVLGLDIGIFKFSPNGQARVYATYIGGDKDEFPHSLICDPQGELVILGRTYSTDYPVTVPREGTPGGSDMIVTKLNAAGSLPIGSMIIGGDKNDCLNIEDQPESRGNDRAISLLRNYGDDSRSEVILDNTGNIYIAASTQSTNFPVRGTPFQSTLKGQQDGVVLKLNPACNSIIWSSYLGGSGDDAALVLALRPGTNEIYVAGATASSDFPGTAPGVISPAWHNDEVDGFVTIIPNNGTLPIRTTYLGTSSIDIIYGIQFDRLGFPYVMGVSRGGWRVENAKYSNAGSHQFISKLKPDLTGYVYSTVFGSGAPKPDISPVAFLVDKCENVYISGWGGWIQAGFDPYDLAGRGGMALSADAIKSTTDNMDFYFIVIKRNADTLLYGSYFGQDGGYGEHVDGGTSRFDQQGAIYQAICANCYNQQGPTPVTKPFLTTINAWGPANGSGNNGCNLAAVKIAFNFSGVGAGLKSLFNGVKDTSGCVPFKLVFRDTILTAKQYEWNFGDGSADTGTVNFEVSHTFNAVGTYRVRLIGIDSSSCNIRDTAYVTIRVRADQAALAFTAEKLKPCELLLFRFDNHSTFPPGKPFGPASFVWDFGDGTTLPAGTESVKHAFAAAGTYIVKLTLVDTNYCNSPESLTDTLRISPMVKARFETPLSGCAPYEATFDNTSLAGKTFLWSFGDGTTSTEVNPVHPYPNVGDYTIKLIVIDSSTCNIIDSTTTTISVHPLPVADFNVMPVPAQVNKPSVFTNLATGGNRYVWYFGDGDSTIKFTTDTVMHQYNATGVYNSCLLVFNQYNCMDSICKPAQAIIEPLLDVPNAFTPGRFGTNSTIRVEGFGIAKMTWKIYNRWGQVVFETHDRKVGWDGSFKGRPQPMDVYAWTLDAQFSDGTATRRTGDITLIR